jgi:hypothetical protein
MLNAELNWVLFSFYVTFQFFHLASLSAIETPDPLFFKSLCSLQYWTHSCGNKVLGLYFESTYIEFWLD